MRYRHVKTDYFFPGLPAGELDSDTLTDEQKMLVRFGLVAGIYEEIEETAYGDRPFRETEPSEETEESDEH